MQWLLCGNISINIPSVTVFRNILKLQHFFFLWGGGGGVRPINSAVLKYQSNSPPQLKIIQDRSVRPAGVIIKADT